MTDTPRAPLPSYSQRSTDEKVDEILRIVRGLADTAVEHEAKLAFLKSEVKINAEDETSLRSEIRHIKKDVERLTFIAERQERRVADHEKSIHALQDDEERRTTYAGDR